MINKIPGASQISYADDLQLIVSIDSIEECHAIATLSFEQIWSWLGLNGLAFNDSMLELSCFNRAPLTGINCDLNFRTVICKPQTSVCNLGVHLNSSMSLDHQDSTTTRTCLPSCIPCGRYATDSPCNRLWSLLMFSQSPDLITITPYSL